MPRLSHVANLWTLQQYPSPHHEWTLSEKFDDIAANNFDAVCWAGSPELQHHAQRHKLQFVGGMAASDPSQFNSLLLELKSFGATHINVQLGTDDMQTPQALTLALALFESARAHDLLPAVETHRGTCTETPEKLYALADSYASATGNLLPVSWDFSHYAIVKHLTPDNFIERLLLRPALIQNASQFHFRPFNGHHAQVPITYADGSLTKEVRQWLPFANATLQCWLEGNRNTSRPLFICPELGPVEGGYALSTFPSGWEDAKVLRLEIEALWRSLTNGD